MNIKINKRVTVTRKIDLEVINVRENNASQVMNDLRCIPGRHVVGHKRPMYLVWGSEPGKPARGYRFCRDCWEQAQGEGEGE